MCLNSGGEMTADNFFSKIFLEEGEKWQRRENDRGYYGILILSHINIWFYIFIVSTQKILKKEKYFIFIRINFTCYICKTLILKLEIIWFKCIILCKKIL